MKFNKLFEPVQIGKTVVKNRIAMAPINNLHQFSPDGIITQRCMKYYIERAKGGVGLIITGVFKVENEIEQLSANGVALWPLFNSKALVRFAELADYIHSYGSKIFIQLSAGAGRNADGEAIDAGFKPVSASAVPAFWRPKTTTKALTTEEVEKMVEDFGDAAELAAKTEIDGIEIHAHEGYLIDEFMTALWNRRNDKYGGDFEGRLRFPKEIIQTIREKVGRDFPLIFRFGLKHYMRTEGGAALRGEGFTEAGRDIQEGLKIAKEIEKADVDALHIDAGCYESWYWAHPPIYQPQGCMVDLAAQVKKIVKIPVLTVGRIVTPEMAEKILEEEKADIIVLGRALLADPKWPNKVHDGKIEDIRPCIGCNDGCLFRPTLGRPLSCAVNPSCGREQDAIPIRTTKPKKILIAGGGVSGMEAARIAAIRGHTVILYEKTEELGGHLIEASVPDFKEDIRRLLEWYKSQLKKLDIKIVFKTEATPQLIKSENPDAVVIATGSTPLKLRIAGGENFVTCCDLFRGKKQAGNTVVVVGGGLEGCETALWLAKQGKKVTIIEILPEVLANCFKSNRDMLLDMLAEEGVQILTNSSVQELTKSGVTVIDKSFQKRFIDCDTAALAIGLESNRNLFTSLANEVANLQTAGDCAKPRNILHAIWDGFVVGGAL